MLSFINILKMSRLRIISIKMLEKEIKILLSNKEYEKLFDIFDFERPFTQTNYYYENSKSAIDKITVRIRQKKDALKLQVKIPKAIDGSLHIKKEYEKEVDEVSDVIDKETLKQLTGIDYEENLYLIGKLVTKRAICNKYNGVEIALDENEYFDQKDYEIEIEYSDGYPQRIVDIIQKQNIKINREISGKNERFRKRLECLKKEEREEQ